MKRKRICLVTISPESEYPRRVMTGVFSQCKQYGYDVVVVSSLVSVCNYYKNYLHGELNIYNIINFELFDGFIITPVPMAEDPNMFLYKKLVNQFKNCPKPVVSVDKEFGSFPVIYTDDKTPFKRITEHLIKKHHCKTFDILTGSDDSSLSNMRLDGIFEALSEQSIPMNVEHIFRGDFWYTSGEELARRYISGELALPDAVICLSDHMAIGLINELEKNDIKVPSDVIVTGFGAVREAAVNTPPVTSFVPDQASTGAEAVNYLRAIIDPAASITPYKTDDRQNLMMGASCGCEEDISYTRAFSNITTPGAKYNYNDITIWDNINMEMLNESYMAELLTGAETPENCLEKIYESKYLLKPYKKFYICLNDSWLNTDADIIEGYSDRMLLAVSAHDGSELHGWENHVFIGEGRERPFSRKKMIPAFEDGEKESFQEPQVYYFAPLHFGKISLGYAVMQNDLSKPGVIGEVYRNYLRNINNALEMSRAKYRSVYLSEHDVMTGLKNRRGMENALKSRIQKADENAKFFAIVIDMDGLKMRNDVYGHAEGDNGISLVAKAVRSITDENEISVRGGGDEFIVLGVGDYTDKQMSEKLSRFRGYLETANETMSIPVEASIGYALVDLDKSEDFQIVLDKADAKMYEDKRRKKSDKVKK